MEKYGLVDHDKVTLLEPNKSTTFHLSTQLVLAKSGCPFQR